MKETEITVQIFQNTEEVERKLLKKGFIKTDAYTLYDEYFSKYSFEELAKMPYGDIIGGSILLRKHIKNGKTTQKMVYKDKVLDKYGNVLSEEKTFVEISDFENAGTILKKAGLAKWCTCINNSSVWEKDFSFALQQIDGLGLFVEIEEDESISNLREEEKIVILKQRAYSLGLKIGNDFSCKKPYLLFKNKMGF